MIQSWGAQPAAKFPALTTPAVLGGGVVTRKEGRGREGECRLWCPGDEGEAGGSGRLGFTGIPEQAFALQLNQSRGAVETRGASEPGCGQT